MLDTVLDRTVIAGYTRVGYRMRRGTWSERLSGWHETPTPVTTHPNP